MPTFDFKTVLKTLPDGPGVYIMKGDTSVLYVGKAKSLKKRVAQYFQDPFSRQNVDANKIARLVQSIEDIEIISTNNEREALLLENELIKKHQPPFNTRLKDDKSFPYVMVTCEEPFPRVAIIRGPERYSKQNLFFGPYTDKHSVVRILKHVRSLFPYCSCQHQIPCRKARPCLYSHMGLCLAPCVHRDEDGFKERYITAIKNLVLFLRGNYTGLRDSLDREMEDASKRLDFERAATIRDKLVALEKMFRPQSIFSQDRKDVDTITQMKNDEEMLVLVMEVRDGRLIGKIPFIYDISKNINQDDEILANFLVEYYHRDKTSFPSKVIVSKPVENEGLVLDVLQKNSSMKIEEVDFLKDDGKPGTSDLLAIGRKNAFFILHKRALNRELATFDHQEGLQDLAEVLHLDHAPVIVEGYDISNIQGKFATASKVCFKEGKPHKNGYRHYRIRSGDTPDDFRMIGEVIQRRFARVVEGKDQPPDLIIIDGGIGQLHAALEQLERAGLDHLSIIGLAKQEEEIFVPGASEPIILPRDSKALQFLQRVRDESHRFALKYHHALRDKQVDETSRELEKIHMIGKQRAQLLKKHFKTLAGMKEASIEELALVLRSRKSAESVFNHFRKTS
nr:excinuclease ABC subunit UvrC [Candidatus Sigynarchaeota archaeon]